MRILGIIPARGGSKGVPGKNIKKLCGKPLIAYPIQQAQRSIYLDKLIVSTDDDAIQEVAQSFRVEVIRRPSMLGMDNSPVVDTVEQVLNYYEDQGEIFDILVLLQPTSPIWTGNQLDEVLSMFGDRNLDGVVSVVSSPEIHPARMYSKSIDDRLFPLIEVGETIRRQDLSPVYFRNGCFYAIRVPIFRKEKTLMAKNKKAYIMDSEWFLNIDSPRDFKIAQVVMEEWINSLG